MKETELGPPVIAWLENMGWDVYQEVQIRLDGPVCDIVATKGCLVWTIELKTNFGLSVIAQANYWLRRYAHYSSIAIPDKLTRLDSKARGLGVTICKERGIGIFSVPESYYRDGKNVCQAKTFINPRLNRHAWAQDIRKVLTEKHKTFAEAGNGDGKRWTPFQNTCELVREAVKKSPGAKVKEIMDSVNHHYASESSARGAIVQWIREGAIKGVKVANIDGRLRLYPEEVDLC